MVSSRLHRPLDPSMLKNIIDFPNHPLADVSPVTGDIAYAWSLNDRFTLSMVDAAGRRRRTLVESDQGISYPAYSPDGKWIAYASDFDGNENHDVFIVAAAGGKPRNITTNPADEYYPTWSPDGRSLAFISNRGRDIENLFVADVETGAARQLTDGSDPVREVAWQPGGTLIAFGAGEVGTWVGVVDTTTGKARRLLDSQDPEFHLSQGYSPARPWSPDGGRLAFLSAEFGSLDVGTLDLASRNISWVEKNRAEKSAPRFSTDGRSLAYLEYLDGDCRVVVRDLGKARRMTASPPGTSARNLLWSPRGGLVYLLSSSTRPEELWHTKPKPRPLVKNFRPKGLIKGRHIHYPSFDGLKIPAMIYIPPKRNGAAVVVPHGGPESYHGNEWRLAPQFFATRGYVVIDPNYRGSTGYGRAYRKLSDRDLGGGDMKDVNEAARYLLRRKLARPWRIGIWGVSYGGYLSLHCPTQEPDLWTAAVPIVGFFNYETCYEGVREYLRTFDVLKMGDVRKEPERFKAVSPWYFLHRLKASVLLFAGANDVRCPAAESRRVAERIKGMGIPCEYREFPDEGHYPRRTSNEMELFERTLAFFDQNLGVRAAMTVMSDGGGHPQAVPPKPSALSHARE